MDAVPLPPPIVVKEEAKAVSGQGVLVKTGPTRWNVTYGDQSWQFEAESREAAEVVKNALVMDAQGLTPKRMAPQALSGGGCRYQLVNGKIKKVCPQQ